MTERYSSSKNKARASCASYGAGHPFDPCAGYVRRVTPRSEGRSKKGRQWYLVGLLPYLVHPFKSQSQLRSMIQPACTKTEDEHIFEMHLREKMNSICFCMMQVGTRNVYVSFHL